MHLGGLKAFPFGLVLGRILGVELEHLRFLPLTEEITLSSSAGCR